MWDAGPAGGGTVADSLARGLKDPRAAYATQTAVCAVAAVAASAAALFSGHFATSVGAAFVGILCDGFARRQRPVRQVRDLRILYVRCVRERG